MLLQEADNFLLGTGIVSRLYMGETLVWPVPSGNFWQFTDNQSCKTLSDFRVVYQNGNVFADWGDGNSDAIISNTNYTHIFQPCDSSSNLFVLNAGKYQTAVTLNDGAGISGRIYISENSGQTWNLINSTFKPLYGVAMSHNGQIQTVVERSGFIYVSENFGSTWTAKTNSPRGWKSVAMSSDGKCQTAIIASTGWTNNVPIPEYIDNNSIIFTSYDSGNVWTSRATGSCWFSIAMSSDGAIQTAIDKGRGIFISNNSGETWSKAQWFIPGYHQSVEDTIPLNYADVSMSFDGKYQTVVIYGGPALTSTNYGQLWTTEDISFTKLWSNVAMSFDGKYQIANSYGDILYGDTLYISNNTGITWSSQPGSQVRHWHIGLAIDYNGQNQSAAVFAGPMVVSNNFGVNSSDQIGQKIWGSVAVNKGVAEFLLPSSSSSSEPSYCFAQKIKGDDLSNYGYSVATNGDGTVLVIGGYNDDDGGVNAGAALIYVGNAQAGWTFKDKLVGDSDGDWFGTSVAINNDGTVIVIGAYRDGASYPGSAFIYTGNAQAGWTFKNKIVGGSAGDSYGLDVAINNDGTVIMVGGINDDNEFLDPNTNVGAVLIYTGNPEAGWTFKDKLVGENPGDHFGHGADINSDGTILIIGARSYSNSAGAAYIYTGNAQAGWTLKDRFIGDSAGDLFGRSVTINNDGTVLVVGSYGDEGGTGSAFIYTGNAQAGWTFKDKLVGDAENLFGHSVNINNVGTVLAIGGPGPAWPGNDAGAAWIYTGSAQENWILKQKITGDPTGSFGHSVAINDNGSVLIMGGPYDNEGGLDAGAAIIYKSC
jgi:hypothetical protein